MTIRGLGHLALSVRDLIRNSDHKKHNVLCCIDCKTPDVDAAAILERHERDLFKLDMKCPGTVHVHGDGDEAELLAKTKNKEGFKLGRQLVDHLAKLGVAEERGSPNERPSSNLNKENEHESHAMMFTPGRIMHLEVEKVDMLKK